MGVALRTRWPWVCRDQPLRPWVNMAPPMDKRVNHCFMAGFRMRLGNGEGSSLWLDNWLPDGGPLSARFPVLFSFVHCKSRTVAEGLRDNAWVKDIRGGLSIQAYLDFFALWDLLSSIQLEPEVADTAVWWPAKNGTFSVKSAYYLLSAGRTRCLLGKIIWKSRAPERCKFFMFCAMKNACLTADNLQRRGWHLAPICHLCSKDIESCTHIFLNCAFSREVWGLVRGRIGFLHAVPDDDLPTWWCAARKVVTKRERKTFDAGVILVTWLIWKERNARVFDGRASSPACLFATIKDEWETWLAAGLIPPP